MYYNKTKCATYSYFFVLKFFLNLTVKSLGDTDKKYKVGNLDIYYEEILSNNFE